MTTEPAYYQRMREAKDRGYSVTEEGVLFGPKGCALSVKKSQKQNYPTFSTNWGGRVYGLPVHKFAAYFFFGESAFQAECVRHLNGDRLDFSRGNLALGTHRENELDKPPEVRRNSAIKARSAQGVAAKNRKLSMEEVKEVRATYGQQRGATKLAADFGVSRTTIYKIVRGEIYVC